MSFLLPALHLLAIAVAVPPGSARVPVASPRDTSLTADSSAVAAPPSAPPGVAVDASVATASRYVWRGLTVTSHPVVQPSASVAIPLGSGALSLAMFHNVEPSRYDAPADLSQAAGSKAGVTEMDLSVGWSGDLGPAALSVMASQFRFPNSAGSTADDNTIELAASVSLGTTLGGRDVELTATATHDVGVIHGMYGEIAASLAQGPARLSAAVGASRGQRGYFERDGITHAQLGFDIALPLGPLTIVPGAQLVASIDPATRWVSATRGRDAKCIAGLAVSWSGELLR